MSREDDEQMLLKVQESIWQTLDSVRVIRRNDYHYGRFIYHLRLAELEFRKVMEAEYDKETEGDAG